MPSSSSWPATVSWWNAHSRVVVFHILHIFQRDTRLCPLIIQISYVYSFLMLRPGSLLFHSSPTAFSAAAVAFAASRAPTRLMSAWYHHRIPNCSPSALSNPSPMSNSDWVAMYCATVFCCCQMYSSIVLNPASSLAASANVYFHFPPGFRC